MIQYKPMSHNVVSYKFVLVVLALLLDYYESCHGVTLQCFDIEAYGAESVVAGNHCRVRIFHPAVVEIATSGSQFFNKPPHRFPRAVAKSVRFLSVGRNPSFAFGNIAGMFDWILVLCRQVGVGYLAYGCDFHFFHLRFLLLIPRTHHLKNGMRLMSSFKAGEISKTDAKSMAYIASGGSCVYIFSM